ncbi:hypothetical protein L484_026431 [Morus notabilis]|uniref:Uncharacterized protein n=1 Tax=Morus notabilis TaxID=981085 RepID=W9QNL3_9ROSA|nr:hypothetical protein L484_026431 [Morus notabilis]
MLPRERRSTEISNSFDEALVSRLRSSSLQGGTIYSAPREPNIPLKGGRILCTSTGKSSSAMLNLALKSYTRGQFRVTDHFRVVSCRVNP